MSDISLSLSYGYEPYRDEYLVVNTICFGIEHIEFWSTSIWEMIRADRFLEKLYPKLVNQKVW